MLFVSITFYAFFFFSCDLWLLLPNKNAHFFAEMQELVVSQFDFLFKRETYKPRSALKYAKIMANNKFLANLSGRCG